MYSNKFAKKKYYEEHLTQYKQNTKVIWKILNELMNRNKTTEYSGNRPGEKILIKKRYQMHSINDYLKIIFPGLPIKLPKQQNILR